MLYPIYMVRTYLLIDQNNVFRLIHRVKTQGLFRQLHNYEMDEADPTPPFYEMH
jgi:hypothetical protein